MLFQRLAAAPQCLPQSLPRTLHIKRSPLEWLLAHGCLSLVVRLLPYLNTILAPAEVQQEHALLRSGLMYELTNSAIAMK